MTNPHPSPGDDRHYEIRIKGHLDDRWSAWFEGLALAGLPGGATLIDCPSIDQAALHGLLRQIRDAGIELVSVTAIDPHQALGPATAPDTASPKETST
jgi:hypothetical protein